MNLWFILLLAEPDLIKVKKILNIHIVRVCITETEWNTPLTHALPSHAVYPLHLNLKTSNIQPTSVLCI